VIAPDIPAEGRRRKPSARSHPTTVAASWVGGKGGRGGVLRWWSPCSGIWGTRATPPPSYWLGEYFFFEGAGGIFDTAASSESFCNGFLLSLYLSVPSDHLPLSQKKQQFRPNSNQANKVN